MYSSSAASSRGKNTMASWKWLKKILYTEKPENAYSTAAIRAESWFLV